jgi:peptide/nickel transport system permease protein
VRRFVAARLVQSLIVVFLVTTISFVLIRLAPGDPFSYEAPNVSPAVRAQLRQQYGFDRPIHEQYARYLGAVARGDLGYSISRRQPVTLALAQTLPRTLLLMVLSIALSFTIGVTIGAAQAVWRGSRFDHASSGGLLFFYSLPDFWLALAMLLAFSYWLPVLPSGGMIDVVMHDYMTVWQRIGDRVRHLILPVTTLVLLTSAAVARYQRSAMLEVLPQEFVRTARAKGLPERQVIMRHALRNALLPVITLLGLVLPSFVGGALFIEKVFSWPGMGYLTLNAISTRDYDVVTAGVIVGGVMVALGNLVSDLLYAVADPRLRS